MQGLNSHRLRFTTCDPDRLIAAGDNEFVATDERGHLLESADYAKLSQVSIYPSEDGGIVLSVARVSPLRFEKRGSGAQTVEVTTGNSLHVGYCQGLEVTNWLQKALGIVCRLLWFPPGLQPTKSIRLLNPASLTDPSAAAIEHLQPHILLDGLEAGQERDLKALEIATQNGRIVLLVQPLHDPTRPTIRAQACGAPVDLQPGDRVRILSYR